jgi:hypothetical protein
MTGQFKMDKMGRVAGFYFSYSTKSRVSLVAKTENQG